SLSKRCANSSGDSVGAMRSLGGSSDEFIRTLAVAQISREKTCLCQSALPMDVGRVNSRTRPKTLVSEPPSILNTEPSASIRALGNKDSSSVAIIPNGLSAASARTRRITKSKQRMPFWIPSHHSTQAVARLSSNTMFLFAGGSESLAVGWVYQSLI